MSETFRFTDTSIGQVYADADNSAAALAEDIEMIKDEYHTVDRDPEAIALAVSHFVEAECGAKTQRFKY